MAPQRTLTTRAGASLTSDEYEIIQNLRCRGIAGLRCRNRQFRRKYDVFLTLLSEGSLGSDAMAESSDEEEAPAAMDSLYPIDGKFKDEADRNYVLSLPELQREEELAKRAEEMNDQSFKRQLFQRTQKNDSKRKAAAADLDESPRKTSKQKTATALEQLKKSRADKSAGRRPDRHDSPPSEGESETPPRSRSTPVKPQASPQPQQPSIPAASNAPAGVRDCAHITLTRNALHELCTTPGFEDACVGAFVRIQAERGSYRYVQVKSFQAGKPYKLENTSGAKPVWTDLYAVVQPGLGGAKQPFSHVSNSSFQEHEWHDYLSRVAKSDGAVRIPTQTVTDEKLRDIAKVRHHDWTNEEIDNRLARQSRLSDPSFGERLRLREARRQAGKDGDDEEIARIDAEVLALDSRTANPAAPTPLAAAATPDAPPNPARTKEQIRNERLIAQAREDRTETMRIADEHRARKKQEAAARAAAKAKARQEEERLKMASAEAGLFGDDDGEAREAANGAVLRDRLKPSRAVLKKVKEASNDEEAIAALDLELDVDI